MALTQQQYEARDDKLLATPDPERIWLAPRCEALSEEGRFWCESPVACPDECGFEPVEYVRLDVAIKGGYRPQSE